MSNPDPPTAESDASRPQCWECRRRRLVCDGAQPVCTKCRAARIVCPGYADKKPLTWLAPGQVLSRRRKKKSPRKDSSIAIRRKSRDSEQEPTRAKCPSSSSSDSGSDKTEELGFQDVPLPVELRAEVCDVFEALLYFNGRIYPDLVLHQLGPNRFSFLMNIEQDIPPAIVHTLVSVAISHRIIQMAPEDSSQNQLVKPIWTRLYKHRGIALNAINELVGNEKARGGILALVSVYTFLFATLQQSFNPCWRTQIDGFMSLVKLRGSFSHILRSIPYMELSMMALWLVGVFANTTSPAKKQVYLTTKTEDLDLAHDFYTETYYPSIPAPPKLLLEIIHINALRSEPPSPETTTTAYALLARIEAFSPEDWSSTPAREDLQPDWLLISSVYHAAVALYAILSLQSSGALPISGDPALELARTRHARKLFALLESALAAPKVRRRMTWPLIVAGVEAAGKAGWGVKEFIGARLAERGREQGCAPPLVAKGVLERFWARGGGRWDDCFGEAMVFII